MTHSHLPVEHLVRQVEAFKSSRQNRGIRPDWVTQLVNELADLFEPTSEVARVGYLCDLAGDCWTVQMFLGSTEVVGGPEDGQSRNTGFHFSLHELLKRFDHVETFHLSAFPAEEGRCDAKSIIAIRGTLGQNRIHLQIHTVPPPEAQPGFRQYADGRCQPV